MLSNTLSLSDPGNSIGCVSHEQFVLVFSGSGGCSAKPMLASTASFCRLQPETLGRPAAHVAETAGAWGVDTLPKNGLNFDMASYKPCWRPDLDRRFALCRLPHLGA